MGIRAAARSVSACGGERCQPCKLGEGGQWFGEIAIGNHPVVACAERGGITEELCRGHVQPYFHRDAREGHFGGHGFNPVVRHEESRLLWRRYSRNRSECAPVRSKMMVWPFS